MSDKKYPKDLHEIYSSTRADVELKLSETETFVSSTTMKSYEVVLNAVNETNSQIRDFISEKSKVLETSVTQGRTTAETLAKVIASIASIESKIAGLDKAKELTAYKQRLSNELNEEVNNLS